jgi:hypothetical protein
MKALILAIALSLVASAAEAKPKALRLHEAIAAVCPIEGVSLTDENDKKTWRIDFAKSATSAQKQAAKDVVKNIDLDAPDEEDEAKKAASTRLKNAVKGDDTAEIVNALKDALKTGALKTE